jgi:hypothetical protein
MRSEDLMKLTRCWSKVETNFDLGEYEQGTDVIGQTVGGSPDAPFLESEDKQ